MKRFIPLLVLFSALLLAGCWQIWNASDLIEWVREQAERRGCDPATIELADWYVEQDGANVWPGTCVNAQTGEAMEFAIGIDRVWKPSAPPPPAPAEEGAAASEGSLTAEALRNTAYSGIYEEPVTLSGGRYEGEPFVAGGAERPTVDYVDGAERYGDLDGDGVDDAVVFLVERGGGTGAFVYVAAQLNRDGQPVDAGAVLIEDRIQVRSVAIQDGQVALDLIVPGPGDGACCPSYQASKRYVLQDGLLAELPSAGEELAKVTAADLEGTSWTLVELGEGQPALDEPPVTISFQEGQISGSGGCNSYTGSFTLGEDNPFVLTVGPLAATAMACDGPIQSQEDAYFAALGTVSQWGYWYGNLALYHADGGEGLGRLLFAPMGGAE